MIHEEVYTYLAALDVVGTNIYYLVLPPETSLPAITIGQVGRDEDHHITGPIGVARSRMRLTVFADTLSEAYDINDSIRQSFDNYSGTIGTLTDCRATLLNIADATPVAPDDGSEDYIFIRYSDYEIRHPE